MSLVATTTRSSGKWTTADWLIPSGLIALALIPIAGGIFRLSTLVGHAEITLANARFFASPIPIWLHVVSVTLYSLLGAFQFSPGIRRHLPVWHRRAGRILLAAGLIAAMSGLWMAAFFIVVPNGSTLLQDFRLFFGAGMVASLVLGFQAIRGGDVASHRAWMRRAYAIGIGAGTQALTQIPLVMILGKLDALPLAVAMGGAWVLNVAVAEWLNLRQRARS